MPLSTLQFTERLGYRQENTLKMLTMGCYNALWALRQHLEAQKAADLDERDRVALGLCPPVDGHRTLARDTARSRANAHDMAVPTHRLRLPRRYLHP